MSRSQLERDRERTGRRLDREAEGQITGLSAGLWAILSDALARLDTDETGRLRFNVRNITAVRQASFQVRAYNQTAGLRFLRWAFGGLRRIFDLNRRYFRQAVPQVPQTLDDQIRRLLLIRYGYDPQTGEIDPNGYLAANVRASGQAQAVAERMNKAISARQDLRAFTRAFRQDFNKPGSPLSLDFHYNRFARDLFQEFDAEAQLQYAQELGLNHAIYSGTAKDNTRCFCLRRLNRIYTADLILTWNDQTWQGKKPGVDVRIARGGFNCRHIFSWISEETAEQLEQRRNKRIDTYNKTLC